VNRKRLDSKVTRRKRKVICCLNDIHMFWTTIIREYSSLNFISKSKEWEEECEDVHTESLNIPPVPQLVNPERNRPYNVSC
jgi:hypothetical protein